MGFFGFFCHADNVCLPKTLSSADIRFNHEIKEALVSMPEKNYLRLHHTIPAYAHVLANLN